MVSLFSLSISFEQSIIDKQPGLKRDIDGIVSEKIVIPRKKRAPWISLDL